MAKNIDEKAKQFMQRPEVFADVFNYFLYDGAPKLQPHDLHELDTTELTLPYGSDEKMLGVQKYRDVLKHAVLMQDGQAAYQIILGVENQTHIHYAMPVKNMIYDALNYGKQVTAIAELHKHQITNIETEAKPSKEEFLSGFYKNDHLLPVITLVIYLGQKPWDGALNLHGMFSKCDSALLQYVPDYKINLIAPVNMSSKEIDKFNSNFKVLATFIRYSDDAVKLRQTMASDEHFKHLDKLTADLAFSVTDSRFKLETNAKGEVNMCKAVDQLIEMGRTEEKAETAEIMLKDKEPLAKIQKYTQLSASRIKEIASSIGVAVVM